MDALRWSEEKLAMNGSQLIANSNANEVLVCILYLFVKPGLHGFSSLFVLVHNWINQVHVI